MQVKLHTTDAQAGTYNGPALLDAVRNLVATRQRQDAVRVHETACQSGCPVGPRMDVVCDTRRVMYFRRKKATGRDDMVSWLSVESLESLVRDGAG